MRSVPRPAPGVSAATPAAPGDAPSAVAGEAPGALPPTPALVRAESGFVWRVLRHLRVPEADLDDALQEVFLVVHRRRESFDGSASVRTWLYGIALRVAMASRRRRATDRLRLEDDVASEVTPEALVQPAEQDVALEALDARRLLERLVAELDQDKRITFVLFEIEGLPMREVAAATGVELKTAYARLYAAREIVERLARRWNVTGRR